MVQLFSYIMVKHNCVRDEETICKERTKIFRAAMATWTKKVDGLDQLWRNIRGGGGRCLMLRWKYTPLYEKAWKKTKNALLETTTQLPKVLCVHQWRRTNMLYKQDRFVICGTPLVGLMFEGESVQKVKVCKKCAELMAASSDACLDILGNQLKSPLLLLSHDCFVYYQIRPLPWICYWLLTG